MTLDQLDKERIEIRVCNYWLTPDELSNVTIAGVFPLREASKRIKQLNKYFDFSETYSVCIYYKSERILDTDYPCDLRTLGSIKNLRTQVRATIEDKEASVEVVPYHW